MSYHKKIIYQKNTKFKIIPDLNNEYICELCKYIDELKLYYVSEVGGTHLFFWKFDPNIHSIVIDSTTSEVSIDFRDQLVNIASWLFDRGFNLDGSFYLRKSDSIEYIIMRKSDRIIKHYVFVEKINIGISYAEYIDDIPIETKIMLEAEGKIQSYINAKKINSNSKKIIYGLNKTKKTRLKLRPKSKSLSYNYSILPTDQSIKPEISNTSNESDGLFTYFASIFAYTGIMAICSICVYKTFLY